MLGTTVCMSGKPAKIRPLPSSLGTEPQGRSIKLGDPQIFFNGNLLLYGGYTHREGLLGKEHGHLWLSFRSQR